jgi:glucose-6-phosphate isomerase
LLEQRGIDQLVMSDCGITLDLSKNRVDPEVLKRLLELAQTHQLSDMINQLFAGGLVNSTEGKPALHHRLRSSSYQDSQTNQIEQLVDDIRRQKLIGSTGKAINSIVNIGVGGSDIGARLLVDAFSESIPSGLSIKFLNTVDHSYSHSLFSQLDLEATLFIVCSKSFQTTETLLNANKARTTMIDVVGEQNWHQHFIGVASNQQAMDQFGITSANQYLVDPAIGGRFSVWSAIGLVARIALGNDLFNQFLQGAENMDEHFKQTDFAENLPVILALIQIWNINFLQQNTFICLPYYYRLKLFYEYQQQMDMESNGKSVNKQGQPISYATSPFIFGQVGLVAQHSFLQLAHQSNHSGYVEFLTVAEGSMSFEDDIAYKSCLAQSRALMTGLVDQDHPHKNCPGDRASTTIVIDQLTPQTLGALMALYEHKVFVQSVIWNTNPFDQFGVELGKRIAESLVQSSLDDPSIDPSTKFLINKHVKG